MISDYLYIKKCLKEIKTRINLGDSSKWTDPDYRVLSKEIEKVTHVSISAQTLKRYYGKIHYKTKFNPQGATKDAFAVYLGYKDWDQYKHAKRIQVTRSKRVVLIPLYISAVLVLISVALWLIVVSRQIETSPLISFEVMNNVGHVPHTMTANYKLDNKIKDSLILNLGYISKMRGYQRILLDPSKSLVNHTFHEPGYYTVSVNSKKGDLVTERIHVLSKGWVCNVMFDMKGSQEELVANSLTINQLDHSLLSEGTGELYIPPETIYNLGANKQYAYKLRFFLFKEYGISGDSCIFEFRFKNSMEDGGISCFDTMVALIAENGRIYMDMMEPACVAWANLTVSEVDMDGHYTDLSPLCMVMSDWTEMKIIVENSEAKFFYNGEMTYSIRYNQALGEIKGLRFGFKGSGKVDYLRLRDTEGNLVFSDEFDKQYFESGS